MSSLFEQKQDLATQTRRTKELNAELEQALAQAQQVKEELEGALKIIGDKPYAVDGIQLAYEMGRLDWVSIILTVFAIFIAVAALWGFRWVKVQSEIIAKGVAQESVDSFMEKMPDMVEKRLKDITPDIVKDNLPPLVSQFQQGLEHEGGGEDGWNEVNEMKKPTKPKVGVVNSIAEKEG